MTNEQRGRFNEAAASMMAFLRTLHPHHKVIVTSETAELLEGITTSGLRPHDETLPEESGPEPETMNGPDPSIESQDGTETNLSS